ncbi:lytic murein transglycosylase B [Massilia solisilvae]|uniref:Lytic murein transglycosylase B n=1 Tax=Massilia solisilvae TaxID=1811225 RepID=A0ABT2BJD9_9BURK|nr:lytic murein transglycosylase B [Massilia solisilvae]MCS0608570.1 lytic murein transglycosylase B [Massilia solisilvae]
MKPNVPLCLALLALVAANAGAVAKDSRAHPRASAQHARHAKPAPAIRKPAIDYEGEQVNFSDWQAVREFEDEMVARHGFERASLDALVRQMRYVESAVTLIKPAPPGKPKNWHAYRERFIEPIRINAGVRFWDENADTLARAQAQYGVPAEILVGLLGIETLYGRDTGRFRVLDALATLAFAYPEAPNRVERMAFFRSELENTLLFAREAGIDPLSLSGSFAGAVGMPQFMPGNILKYGVDFDGDGRIDLRGSAADAIGSVANYLARHGWDRNAGGPPAIPAEVSPSRAWESMLGGPLAARYKPSELAAAGVSMQLALPDDRLYGLVDLQNGAEPTEYWVANDNFFAITNYNRSFFYAMSVIELGRAVRVARGT